MFKDSLTKAVGFLVADAHVLVHQRLHLRVPLITGSSKSVPTLSINDMIRQYQEIQCYI